MAYQDFKHVLAGLGAGLGSSKQLAQAASANEYIRQMQQQMQQMQGRWNPVTDTYESWAQMTEVKTSDAVMKPAYQYRDEFNWLRNRVSEICWKP